MSTDQKEAFKKEILEFHDRRDVNKKTCYECKHYDPETGYYQETYPRCKLGREKEVFDRDGCEQREFEPNKYVGDETLETVVELCGKRDAEIASLRAKVEELEKAKVKMFPIYDFGMIPWSIAEKAYAAYCKSGGYSQSLERIAARGGFYPVEMDTLYPGWRDESSLIKAKDAEIAKLREALSKDALLEVIEEWQMIWRNQNINPEDTKRYRRRALSVDANMRGSLARMISEKALSGETKEGV
ncbi:hypothetical protein [Bdellovibrio bacteriovorus]|uniref:hypothetical protein n=1 Tax=Bdellovibrio bacteriovorus TaxID=959 RepID=UPI003AA9A1D2